MEEQLCLYTLTWKNGFAECAEPKLRINQSINQSGIGTKSYGFLKFRNLKINLAIGFIRKNQLECIGKAVMMLYLVKRSDKLNISTYSQF